MTYEEANNLIDDITWSYGGKLITSEDIRECRRICHEALNKQIPKKPKKIVTHSEINKILVKSGYCPSCKDITTCFNSSNYCHWCGQALDWSEDE